MRKTRMESFRWTSLQMDSFPAQCRTPSLSNAVSFLSFCVDLAIIPRSPKREKIMREEWAQAQKVGVDFSHLRFEVA